MLRAVGLLVLVVAACGGGAEGVPGGESGVARSSPTLGSAEGDSAASAERRPLIGGEVPEGVCGRPNVLVITIDTLRADHLGFHGYPRATSPFLDELAADSIVFERAYAPIATTLPSHTTMFTGVSPLEHGVLANIADGRTYRRREDLETLAELFLDSGYATHAVVSAYPLRPEFGLDTGFETYDPPQRKKSLATRTTDKALAICAEDGDARPSFLWVHYFDPHGPYNPPLQYASRFEMSEGIRARLAERQFAERAQRPTGQWNELEDGIDSYDGEIAYADDEIGRFVRGAKRVGWIDDTTVIAVLADHGEGLNQHGTAGHGLVWEEQLHVPMFIRAPGVAARRLDAPVTLADFAPTLLHLLDLPHADEFLAQASGVDRLTPTTAHDDLRLLGQTSPRQSASEGIGYSLRAGRWKLHRATDGEHSLYDLDTDPFELEDVAADRLRVVRILADELDELLAARRVDVRTEAASDQARDELRSLGYGGDGGR